MALTQPRTAHPLEAAAAAKHALPWAAVATLFVVQAFSFIDRQAVSLLIQPIKADLGLTDTSISLIIGFGFAAAYALAGFPIGRAVDRGKRPVILAAGLALWSLCTAGCAFVRSFGQLFAARAGVGVGEATMMPVALSLLGDYFPPRRRGLAFGIVGMSAYLGTGLSLIVGGLLVSALGANGVHDLPGLPAVKSWQIIFLLIGLPGLLVLPLVLTLPEPRNGLGARRPRDQADLELSAVAGHYRLHRQAILSHHFSNTLMAMLFYGVAAWVPEFLRRTYGIPLAQAGLYFGGVAMIAGALGVLAGGLLSDALVAKGRIDGRLLTTLIGALGAAPLVFAFPLAPSAGFSLALLFAMLLFSAMITSAGSTGLQDLTRPRMRGIGSAIYFFIFNGLGMSLGPLLFALSTDHVFGNADELWKSIAAIGPLLAGSAACIAFLGLGPYRRCAAANLEIEGFATPEPQQLGRSGN